eukprot:Nitzschia sp. Nitz4//scaffold133_size116822//18521//19437//NITZ4_003794-RA/size116822-processed-gene-0.50-mRNA-1//-1//CDS//3329535357//5731//frame0
MKIIFASIAALVSITGTMAVHQPPINVGAARRLSEQDRLDLVVAKDLLETEDRRLDSNETVTEFVALDKMEVMIKNVDCSACMEAPEHIPVRKLSENLRGVRALSPAPDVFVTSLDCSPEDSFQVWNLLSLEPTGVWYLFESTATGECMQVVGQCSPDGSLYDIEMGPCDADNSKAIWGLTGVGEIVNFECFRSNYESDTLYHSTPDIFLEASCGNTGGRDRLDLSSNSADSIDQAENTWVFFPKALAMLPANP